MLNSTFILTVEHCLLLKNSFLLDCITLYLTLHMVFFAVKLFLTSLLFIKYLTLTPKLYVSEMETILNTVLTC